MGFKIEWNISARVILAWMFHHGNISAHAPFSAADISADGLFITGTFRHGEFSAQGIFGTRNFWHLNISAQGYFGTWTFRHLDILAPCKAIWTFRHLCYSAEMSMYENFPVSKCSRAENSSCQKVLVPKSPHVKIFPCWNVHLPECLHRQMVHVPKCSRDETSVPKWPLPKCSMPKWSIGDWNCMYELIVPKCVLSSKVETIQAF